jgi:hypothetical protein
MKFTQTALRRLIKEAIKDNKILAERPWSVEYTFSLSGDAAEDSEGASADGFVVTLASESGTLMRVIVDSYWNPQSGDQSGNSIRVEVDSSGEGEPSMKNSVAHVPHKFDDGKKQKIVLSNSPIQGIITISHAVSTASLPIVYLAVANPFSDNDDITFDVKVMGNGDLNAEMTDSVNI